MLNINEILERLNKELKEAKLVFPVMYRALTAIVIWHVNRSEVDVNDIKLFHNYISVSFASGRTAYLTTEDKTGYVLYSPKQHPEFATIADTLKDVYSGNLYIKYTETLMTITPMEGGIYVS